MADPFFGQGLLSEGIPFQDAKDAQADVQRGARIVDLRQPPLVMMKSFDLPEGLYLDYSRWQFEWQGLPVECPLILVDAVGVYSKHAAQFLRERAAPTSPCSTAALRSGRMPASPFAKTPRRCFRGAAPVA